MAGSSHHRRLAAIVAGAALAFAGTACDDGEADGVPDLLRRAPLDPAAAEALARERETRIQDLVRDCMAREGFEYVPVDPGAGTPFPRLDDPAEQAATYGYGLTTWYDPERVVEQAEDRNARIADALPEAERRAYDAALYGSPEETLDHATVVHDPETGEEVGLVYEGHGFGCMGEARRRVLEGRGEGTQEVWDVLDPALDELHARVLADPELVAYEARWSRCMVEAGYDVRDHEQLRGELWPELTLRLIRLMHEGEGFDPFEGWSDAEIERFEREGTDDERRAWFEDLERQHVAEVDGEALEALQQEEIDLAVADLACSDEPYDELYERVAADHEAAFVDQHRELLEQLDGAG